MKSKSNFSCRALLIPTIAATALVSMNNASAEIVFLADSESASLSEWISSPGDDGQSQMCCGRPGSYDYLTNDVANAGPATARAGNYFLKLVRTANQPQSRGRTVNGNKVVINHTDEGAQEGYRQERWAGLSMWVPSWVDTSILQNATWNYLFGWHGKHTKEPTYLMVDLLHDNTLFIRSRTTTVDLHNTPSEWWDVVTETTHYSAPMPRDQWVDFVLHYRIDERPLQSGGQGMLEVWMNGTQVVDYDGPFGFYHSNVGDIAGYFQVGNYTTDALAHDRAYYYDEIRIGDGAESYSSVSPETFSLPRPNPPTLISD